jgi:monoterpene epsilon-lactone hydrolase
MTLRVLWIVMLAMVPMLAFSQTRSVPERTLGVPQEFVSPELQKVIGAAPPTAGAPITSEEWITRRNTMAEPIIKNYQANRERLEVEVEKTTIAGVNCFVITPHNLPQQNQNRLLIHFHGGYYIFFPGESGIREGMLMASYGHMKVISVDYRLAPEHPFPAGQDDAVAVWKAVVQTNNPQNMAVFGTSAGGGMTLGLMLRAKQEGLPLPAAIAPGTPAADLTGSGDSYQTNKYVDNNLVSYDRLGAAAAKLYANGHDLKEPLVSPIFADFTGLPPAIILTGTRDLQLSDAVNVHRKLLHSGGVAELHVFEGQSHAQYLANAPETQEALEQIAAFFDRYLRR